ncbi:hypothetical protein Deipe_4458 (plasmid) [Deinococcus peraridilitoris DSM 19664]|uniref:Uncharacterized protein n=1 Tax=Deinococcus peraridilitoris (strain DSM 19664 / LMG 22246 / CIP 109416 / KR-200) TaxID=937777 RepID=L0A7J2_DEIPD|nr:hypothetical protein Deipe_4458 [Deinococcus peraridilitoris DSM 19664]
MFPKFPGKGLGTSTDMLQFEERLSGTAFRPHVGV